MQITVTIDGCYSSFVYNHNVFYALKDSYVDISDTGSSTTGGFPWTPQRSQIPTSSTMNFWDNSMWNNIVNGRGYVVGGVAEDLGTFTPIQWESFFTKHIARQMGTFRCFINKDHAGVDTQTYATYGVLTTIKPWTDSSGGSIIQYFEAHDVVLKRYESLPDRNWTPWIVVQSFEVDIKKLFQSVSEGKADNRAALAQKGVQIPQDPTFAQISQGIRDIPAGGKKANGLLTSASTLATFNYKGGGVVSMAYVDLTGLSFTPSIVVLMTSTGNGNMSYSVFTSFSDPTGFISSTKLSLYNSNLFSNSPNHNLSHMAITGGFRFPVTSQSANYTWYAYE